MSLVRVHNFSIVLDGFATGEGQSRDAHFGHAGERLHEWMFGTRWWSRKRPGGSGGIDDAFARLFEPGIGAEIMGAGKFGHPGLRAGHTPQPIQGPMDYSDCHEHPVAWAYGCEQGRLDWLAGRRRRPRPGPDSHGLDGERRGALIIVHRLEGRCVR